jgi:ABC-2 type transport system ATP-binding protein
MAKGAALTLDSLSKRYRGSKNLALDTVSLQVTPGEVYGFLGANGAGKSTAIRTILNFIQPTSGTVTICGLDSVTESVEAKRHIGYLAGDIALYPTVTAGELFAYMARLQQRDCSQYLARLVDRFGVDTHKKIGELSKGNRQKVGVVLALMHEPDVLVMDEPTSGLDPLMQEEFYEAVREASQRGAAVLVSSHNLTEAQRICNRVGIIKQGKLIREQTIKDSSNLNAQIFRVVFKHASDAAKLASSKSLKILNQTGAVATVQPVTTISAVLQTLAKFEIVDFRSEQLDLEDEFLEYYGDAA